MALHQRRRRRRLHWADFVAAGLLTVSLAPFLVWLGEARLGAWTPVAGVLESASFHRYASNVDRLPDEVVVAYRYEAGGLGHTGQWQGPWPVAYSPDAIPRESQEALLTSGRTLTVYHDPLLMGRSTLHTPHPRQSAFLPVVSCVAFPLTLAALRRAYPRFRRR